MGSEVNSHSRSVHPELVLSPLLSNLGSSSQQQIKRAIAENNIVIFGSSYCPFCLEVNRLFKSLGVRYANFNLDKEKDGAALRAELTQLTNQKTVPYVFINQVSIVRGTYSWHIHSYTSAGN
jgi:glutaredoxin 3